VMIVTLATVLLTASTMTAHTDTTFSVPTGSRLSVNNFGGVIAVRPWGKNAVRIEAEHSERARISVDRQGTSFEVTASTRRGIPARIDYKITAPAWMALNLEGVYTDVSVEGWKSDILAETVKGEVNVQGGEGLIKLSSVEGEVTLTGGRGRIELTAVNEGVNVSDVAGDLTVDAVNGDVLLARIKSKLLEASTVNGDVHFSGPIDDAGRYRFSSHNGDIEIIIADRTNATIAVSTFSGGIESDFPIQIQDSRKGHRMSFTLGTGKASIDLETFEGTINLRRAEGGGKKEKE
jgi:DUF4097 and DUF4098 domain-containing protein YvlB